jgi:predicted TPR repeat methyltransferase
MKRAFRCCSCSFNKSSHYAATSRGGGGGWLQATAILQITMTQNPPGPNQQQHPNADHHAQLPVAWQKIYAAQSPEQLLAVYQEWSQTYDTNSIQEYGYVAPHRAAQEFHKHLSTVVAVHNDNDNQQLLQQKLRLVDIGAGTGLVGEYLFQHYHYTNLCAMDFSPHMLQVAQTKNCYATLYQVDLNQKVVDMEHHVQQQQQQITNTTRVPHLSKAFDGAISVGTFTDNHVGVAALYNVLDLIKPGGILTLSLTELFAKDADHNQFIPTLEQLVNDGVLQTIEITSPELYTSKVSDTLQFRIYTYRVLK